MEVDCLTIIRLFKLLISFFKSPGDLTALRCPNAETRSWLSELPIELWFLIISLLFDKRLYIWSGSSVWTSRNLPWFWSNPSFTLQTSLSSLSKRWMKVWVFGEVSIKKILCFRTHQAALGHSFHTRGRWVVRAIHGHGVKLWTQPEYCTNPTNHKIAQSANIKQLWWHKNHSRWIQKHTYSRERCYPIYKRGIY